MNRGDDVRIKSGILKGSTGILEEIIEDSEEDFESYRVKLKDVAGVAHVRGHRTDDVVDMDKHELELIT